MSQIALDRLTEKFPQYVVEASSYRGDERAIIKREAIVDVLKWLRDTPGLQFDMLSDLTAVDYLGGHMGKTARFEVVYHLYSVALKHRVRIKVAVPDEDPTIDTVCELWRNANWQEREIWDFYGIRFNDHPDMRRILLYEEFEGHPLRKDYPKQKRQPLSRRPAHEIAQALAARPGQGKNLAA